MINKQNKKIQINRNKNANGERDRIEAQLYVNKRKGSEK